MGMNNRDGWQCPYFYFLFWLIAEPLIQFILYIITSVMIQVHIMINS